MVLKYNRLKKRFKRNYFYLKDNKTLILTLILFSIIFGVFLSNNYKALNLDIYGILFLKVFLFVVLSGVLFKFLFK